MATTDFFFFGLARRAARRLRASPLCAVCSAMPGFFHRAPPGRIIDRFGAGVGVLDRGLPAAAAFP